MPNVEDQRKTEKKQTKIRDKDPDRATALADLVTTIGNG